MTATNQSPESPKPTPSPSGRTGNGRFAKGNTVGKGNPFARKCASLRAALLRKFDDASMERLAEKLLELALQGDVAAARLVLQYVIGKPTPAIDPDDLDRLEWEHEQRQAVPLDDVKEAQNHLPVTVAVLLASAQRTCNTLGTLKGFQEQLAASDHPEDPEAPEPPSPTEPPAPPPRVLPLPPPVNQREKPARRCANPRQSRTPHRQLTVVSPTAAIEPPPLEREDVPGSGVPLEDRPARPRNDQPG